MVLSLSENVCGEEPGTGEEMKKPLSALLFSPSLCSASLLALAHLMAIHPPEKAQLCIDWVLACASVSLLGSPDAEKMALPLTVPLGWYTLASARTHTHTHTHLEEPSGL